MLRALITNIQAIAKSSKKKHLNREPYFDKQWGSDAAFSKTVEREDYNVVGAQDTAAEIYEQILVMYKTTKVEPSRNSFLTKLACDSQEFLEEQRTRLERAQQEEELCHASMAAMVEQIFEVLKSYAYELNNSLGYGPLHVAATNPQQVTEIVKFNSLRQAEETITYYRARLSTPYFSLVMRGDKKGIQFFVMPVSRAIGLSKQECHFLPIAKMTTSIDNGEVSWCFDDCMMTASHVEYICMNVFQRLIEETKEQVRHENSFEQNDEEEVAS
jgi:hypothetical protein